MRTTRADKLTKLVGRVLWLARVTRTAGPRLGRKGGA